MSFMEAFAVPLGAIIALALIGFVGYIAWQGHLRGVAKQEAFMTECMEDHKRYECTIMWRSGEPDTIPVFIPIPTGR